MKIKEGIDVYLNNEKINKNIIKYNIIKRNENMHLKLFLIII